MLKVLLKLWFTAIQYMTVPVNFVLTILLNLEVKRPPNLRITHGTFIVANHQSKIDPFLVTYHVGVKNWTKIVPVRYPVTPDYMDKPMLGFCIRLLGGYNIGSSTIERMQRLLLTRDLLRAKYNILLFPEGKIVRDTDMVADFERGAKMLFSENVPIVFVRLVGLNAKHKFHFWKNPYATLEYSEPLDPSMSIEEKTKRMMDFYA